MIKLQAISYKLKPNPHGFIALVTIVIIAAAALVMSLNSSFLGLSVLDFGFLTSEGSHATALVEGCAEAALGELRVNPAYTGIVSPGLSIFGGSCIIEVVNLDGGSENSRQVAVMAVFGDFTRQVIIAVTLGYRSLTINSWQES